MLTMKEAVRYADSLEKSFSDVVISGESKHPVILAKGHNKIPTWQGCQHERICRAVNVNGVVKDGYLVSGDSPVLYSRIDFCARCEKVMELVR